MSRILFSIMAVVLTACVDGDQTAILKGHTSNVSALSFSPDGRWLASGGWDKSVIIWDVANSKKAGVLSGHADRVMGVAFMDDNRLVSADFSGSIIVWSRHTGKALKTMQNPHTIEYMGLQQSKQQLVVKGGDSIRVWDLESARVVTQTKGEPVFPRSPVALTSDGKVVFVTGRLGSTARGIGVWDSQTQRFEPETSYPIAYTESMVLSPDDTLLAVSGLDNGIWQMAGRRLLHGLNTHCGLPNAMVFTPDGKVLVSSWQEADLMFSRADNGDALLELKGHTGPIDAIAVSRDGQWVATGSQDQTVRLWQWQQHLRDADLSATPPAQPVSVGQAPSGK